MFDSHCHVTDIDDRVGCLALAKAAGVGGLLTCGYDAISNREVVKLGNLVPGLPIGIGLHPWYAREPLEPILALIERARPVAVGECGLDGDTSNPAIPPLDVQRQCFEAQLDLAVRKDLPVSVHSRWAVNEVVAVARHFPRLRGVLHAYSGSFEQVEAMLNDGWLVGLGGAITKARAKRIRRLAERLSLEQIVFETDAPAIGLADVAPADVRPHHVVDVLRVFAALRGFDFDEVVEQTDRNARRVFGDAAFATWAPPR